MLWNQRLEIISEIWLWGMWWGRSKKVTDWQWKSWFKLVSLRPTSIPESSPAGLCCLPTGMETLVQPGADFPLELRYCDTKLLLVHRFHSRLPQASCFLKERELSAAAAPFPSAAFSLFHESANIFKMQSSAQQFPVADFTFAMANTFHNPSPNIWFSAKFSTGEIFLHVKKAAFWTYHSLALFLLEQKIPTF